MEDQQEKRKRKSSTDTPRENLQHVLKSYLLYLNCQDVLCCWLMKADAAPHQPQHKVLLAQGHRSKLGTTEKGQREA